MRTLFTLAAATALTATAALAQMDAPGSHFVENWDYDRDGQVTLEEATQKRGEIFFMFDQDENGVLDSAEYDLFDETRALDRENNAAEHEQMGLRNADEGMNRANNDPDGDGMVTEAEFNASTESWFTGMDSDGDGVLTAADFGPGKRGKGQGQGMGKANKG